VENDNVVAVDMRDTSIVSLEQEKDWETGLPGLLDGGLALTDLSIKSMPSRRVTLLGINVFEGHREMYIKDIEIT